MGYWTHKATFHDEICHEILKIFSLCGPIKIAILLEKLSAINISVFVKSREIRPAFLWSSYIQKSLITKVCDSTFIHRENMHP